MKILCFGDSNTYGYDPRSFFGDRYPAQCRWVDLLAWKLGCETVNAGLNGRTIPKREEEWVLFRRLLAAQEPVDLLVILLGTNDLLQGNPPEAVADRMERFCNQMELEKSKILLIGPPILQLGEWVPSRELVEASATLNKAYKALSERLCLDFVDAGAWNIPLAFDGVHFTEEGHRKFAEALGGYLNKGA